jgi:DNA-directed RNA polymerase III subunit RPC8
MFILTTIESDIRVHPKDLNKPPLVAVTDVIEQQYLDKVVPDLGLPVTIYDVQNIGEPALLLLSSSSDVSSRSAAQE